MVFTSRPRKVSTLGLIRARASQRTIASSSTPQPRPKALVQVMQPRHATLSCGWSFGFGLLVDGGQAQYFHLAITVGRNHDRAVSHLFVQQGAPNGRAGGD